MFFTLHSAFTLWGFMCTELFITGKGQYTTPGRIVHDPEEFTHRIELLQLRKDFQETIGKVNKYFLDYLY